MEFLRKRFKKSAQLFTYFNSATGKCFPHPVTLDICCKTKISYLDSAIIPEEDVVRLNVPVDNALLVKVIDPFQNLKISAW